MRTGRVSALVLSISWVLLLLAPGVAWAHVTVSPKRSQRIATRCSP
jgi:hypothetical protein